MPSGQLDAALRLNAFLVRHFGWLCGVAVALCAGCGEDSTPRSASTKLTSTSAALSAPPRVFDVIDQPTRSCCHSIAVSPDGRLAATSQGEEVVIWDLASGLEFRSFTAIRRPVANRPNVPSAPDQFALAFDPSGRYVAATSVDFARRGAFEVYNTVTPPNVWDVETGRDLSDVQWTFEPKNQRLSAGGFPFDPREPAFWQISRTAGVPARLARSGKQADAFSADGMLAAQVTGENNGPQTIQITEVPSGRQRWTATISRPRQQYALFRIEAVFFSHDGRWVAASGGGRWLHIWDVSTGKEVTPAAGASFDDISAAAFSSDGRRLAILDGHRGGSVLSTTNWTLETRMQPAAHSYTNALEFTPDGRHVLRLEDAGLQVWDAATGSLTKQIAFVASQASTSIAVSPDGAWLALGTENTSLAGALWLWPLRGATERRMLWEDAEASVVSSAFSPDGRRFAAATFGRHFANRASGVLTGNIVVCNVPGCDARTTLLDNEKPLNGTRRRNHTGSSEAAATGAVFTPDGKTLIGAVLGNSAYIDSEIRFLEFQAYPRLAFYGAESLRVQRVVEPEGGAFTALAIARDGRLAATGQDEFTVRLWDVEGRRELRMLHTIDPATGIGHTRSIRGLAFSPDNAWLATGGDDNRITIWNTSSGSATRVVGEGAVAYGALALDRTGRLLVASRCADDTHAAELVAWDTVSWAERWSVTDSHNACRNNIVFSPDGRWLAATTRTGVHVYDSASGRRLIAIALNARNAWLAWTPDGRFIGNDDGIDRLAAIREGRSARALRVLPASSRVADLLARVLAGP